MPLDNVNTTDTSADAVFQLTHKSLFLVHAEKLGIDEIIARKLWSGLCWEILRAAKQQDSDCTGGCLAVFGEEDGGLVLPVRFTEEGE